MSKKRNKKYNPNKLSQSSYDLAAQDLVHNTVIVCNLSDMQKNTALYHIETGRPIKKYGQTYTKKLYHSPQYWTTYLVLCHTVPLTKERYIRIIEMNTTHNSLFGAGDPLGGAMGQASKEIVTNHFNSIIAIHVPNTGLSDNSLYELCNAVDAFNPMYYHCYDLTTLKTGLSINSPEEVDVAHPITKREMTLREFMLINELHYQEQLCTQSSESIKPSVVQATY